MSPALALSTAFWIVRKSQRPVLQTVKVLCGPFGLAPTGAGCWGLGYDWALAAAGASSAAVARAARGAMRGLMRSAPQGYAQAAVPTILTLLEDKRLGRPAPMSVMAYDVAYLKALYAMSNSLQAVPQRGELVSRMKTYIAASN